MSNDNVNTGLNISKLIPTSINDQISELVDGQTPATNSTNESTTLEDENEESLLQEKDVN